MYNLASGTRRVHAVTHGIWELSQAGHVDPETLGARAGGELVEEGYPLLSPIVLYQA